MIEADDAVRVLDTVAKNLMGVSYNKSNFERLPDTFWGYFARGHDGKGKFGVIVTYSENERCRRTDKDVRAVGGKKQDS